jgi:hypothetical protein
MRVVKAHNVQTLFASLTLYAYQVAWVDVEAILGSVGSRVLTAHRRAYQPMVAFFVHRAQQHATAFMRIGFLAVPPNLIVIRLCEFQHVV